MIVTDLSKMLIAASSIGIYIIQENGHRYIHADVREISHWQPSSLHHADFVGAPDPNTEDSDPVFVLKHYGSYLTALRRIESWLPVSLLEIYDNLNYADTIVGLGEVE